MIVDYTSGIILKSSIPKVSEIKVEVGRIRELNAYFGKVYIRVKGPIGH